MPDLMRKLLFISFIGALTIALLPAASSAGTSTWTAQANQVCSIWLVKAKQLFATPVKPAGLYKFANDAKNLESQELAQLAKIPNPSAAGTHALGVMNADIAEVGSAIKAYDRGDAASFIRILKLYLNDHRSKVAFAAAGAHQCG
jgi:hypothetical protein